MGVNSVVSCNHSRHLFERPLCDKQSFCKRVFNVVFHILTLCIPLLVYKMMSCCCKKRILPFVAGDGDTTVVEPPPPPPPGPPPPSKPLPIPPPPSVPVVHPGKPPKDTVSPPKPPLKQKYTFTMIRSRIGLLIGGVSESPFIPLIPQEGIEALKFAHGKLKEYYQTGSPDILQDKDDIGMPINKEIIILKHLYEDSFNKFTKKLQDFGENAWDHNEMFKYADTVFMIAYALSILTLDDTGWYCQKHSFKERYEMCMESEHNLYLRDGLFKLTYLYHNLRNRAATWNAQGELGYSLPIPQDYTRLFFDMDSKLPCMSWRLMYNDCCRRIRAYFDEEIIKSVMPNLMAWFTPDLDEEHFIRNPSKGD